MTAILVYVENGLDGKRHLKKSKIVEYDAKKNACTVFSDTENPEEYRLKLKQELTTLDVGLDFDI